MTTPTQQSSHTPGPWYHDGFLILTNSGKPKPIATVFHDEQGLGLGIEESLANTRLIAAAPDLLAVCQMTASTIKVDEVALLYAARAAIAKLKY